MIQADVCLATFCSATNCRPTSPVPAIGILLLEDGDACRTWAIETLPDEWARRLNVVSDADDEVPATNLSRHRLHYLTFEGPVSNNRGHVTRVAAGNYSARGFDDDRIVADFQRGAFDGTTATLVNTHERWRLAVHELMA